MIRMNMLKANRAQTLGHSHTSVTACIRHRLIPLMQLGFMDRYTSKLEDARSLKTPLALGVTANTQPQGNTMTFFRRFAGNAGANNQSLLQNAEVFRARST